MKFSGYLLFLALWSVLVYAPLAHWVWGGGFLGANGVGAIDFAGGTVVHINAGVAALAVILYLGKRRGYGSRAFVPHNVPMLILGAGILWFGWFGFNAGSALAAGGLASSAFVATQLGAASAMLGWLIPEWLQHGKATTIGAATGAVAGLVAITPASGYVGPLPAIAIGLAGGAVCYFAVGLKSRLGYDGPLPRGGRALVWGGGGGLLRGGAEITARLRRLARRGRRAHGRRDRRSVVDRRVRQPGRQPGRCGRRHRAARKAGRGRRRDPDLLVRRHVGDPQGH